MTSARETLTELRREIVGLLAEIDATAPPSSPVRIGDRDADHGGLRYWHESEVLSVHTLTRDDGPFVYLAAGQGLPWRSGDGRMSWAPDWTALVPDEARRLGLALLAAANDAEADIRP